MAMELKYAFFARHVEPAQDGTLIIVGADLGRVEATQYPVVIPHLVAVAVFGPTAPDTIRFKFVLRGPEPVGVVIETEGWQEAKARKEENSLASEGARLVLPFPFIVIPAPGEYRFELVIEQGPTLELRLRADEKAGGRK